jgi:hypothetical protein
MGLIVVVDEGTVVIEEYMVVVEEHIEHIVVVDEVESCERMGMKESRSLSLLAAQYSPGHTNQKQ